VSFVSFVVKIFIQPLVNWLMMNSSENKSLFHAKAQRRKVKNKALANLAALREVFIPTGEPDS